MKKTLITAVLAGTAVAFTATGAFADIACVGNTCWHVKEKYTYPKESKVVIHEETWKPSATVTFKEHEGRGYWKGDAWTSW